MFGRIFSGFIMISCVICHSVRSCIHLIESDGDEGPKSSGGWTDFLEYIKICKFLSDLSVPERILLVRHFGNELSSGVFVEELVSDRG